MSKIKLRYWFLAVTLLAAGLGGYGVYDSSARPMLRRALRIRDLPPSIRNVRMGSDVWTDAVYDFYFEIAPPEFPRLLRGRDFSNIPLEYDYAIPVQTRTGDSFRARYRYSFDQWKARAVICEVYADETMSKVIVHYAHH
jgi:hypothetical protein